MTKADKLIKQLNNIGEQASTAVQQAKTANEIEDIRLQFLGRKSELNQLLRGLKDVEPERRKDVGATGNEIKQRIQTEITQLETKIANEEYKQQLQTEWLDITASSNIPLQGELHPITRERIIVEDILVSMGFEIHEPRLIDDEYNNFTALNIPANHPAKDMWDTIWTENDNYLITHTSSMQNRIISGGGEPPIRAIVPGRCFRNEATDRTHEHSFFQLEGIYVDKGIKFTDLVGVLKEFLAAYYQREVPIKIQPTYFPFVEPGLEVMINYDVIMEMHGIEESPLAGEWIEVIPCGPIHPNVLKEGGLEPDTYSGFAWGIGLDRLVMLKYGIDDIRLIHSGKLDFTRQFN